MPRNVTIYEALIAFLNDIPQNYIVDIRKALNLLFFSPFLMNSLFRNL